MKEQLIGCVLCALLLSTFGQEILNRHQEGHSARLAHSRAKTSLLSRHNDGNGRCQVICDQGYYNLTIAVNSSSSVHFAVHNSSSGIVLELDLEARSVLVFNRTSKWGVLINYESESVLTLDLRNNGHELEEFPGLIKENISLSSLSQDGQKISKEEASKFIRESLILLTAGEYTVSVSESWDLLIHVARSVTASLKVVLVVVPTEIFTVSLPLNRVFESIEGLVSVATQTGVKILIDHQVTISLKVLLSFKSAFGIAGYIWEQLSKKTDLDHVYPALNTSTDVLEMLASWVQNSTSGVNGYITAISKILLFNDGRESLHIVEEVLIEFLVKNKGNPNLVAEARAETRALLKIIVKLRIKKKLKVVYNTLQLILEHKLVEGGVGVGAIIGEISDGINNENLLKLVLKVLNCLQKKTSIQIGVAHLVLHFVELLTVRGGAEVIATLVGIRVSEEISNAGSNALTEILRGVTINGLWGGKLGKKLRDLPVLGQAIVEIDVQLKALEIHVTVEEALKSRSSGGIVRIIIEVIEGALKHIEPVKPIPVITSQSASSSVDIEHSTKVSENTESSSKGEDGPVSFPPAPEAESVSSSEGPHNGKIQISGLQGASGSDRSNGHKETGQHATHGKFYHTHEKHYQQQGKHYTHENQNKA